MNTQGHLQEGDYCVGQLVFVYIDFVYNQRWVYGVVETFEMFETVWPGVVWLIRVDCGAIGSVATVWRRRVRSEERFALEALTL